MSGIRPASHAGSWYTRNATKLESELDNWLGEVPDKINGSDVPIKGARVIIAPHAGYSYSGPCAAWAYKVFDVGAAKRVFVLGPSHTYYLSGCALTTYAAYETPLGNLKVDADVVKRLADSRKFKEMPRRNDESEHSLEMHLPYLAKRLRQARGDDAAAWPTIVPILVGDNKRDAEKAFGELLLPYLSEPENAFIVSSDFCHWGSRFSYTAYTADGTVDGVRSLGRTEGGRKGSLPVPIHEGIRALDHLAMDAIETGSHDAFYDNLKATGNTVCGRHPIGVIMAALEMLKEQRGANDGGGGDGDKDAAAPGAKKGDGVFTFINYDRSSLVEDVNDSSVSYAAAYAIL